VGRLEEAMRKAETLINRYKVSVRRRINSGVLLHNMVTILDNILCTSK
jgi:hypothetical protein